MIGKDKIMQEKKSEVNAISKGWMGVVILLLFCVCVIGLLAVISHKKDMKEGVQLKNCTISYDSEACSKDTAVQVVDMVETRFGRKLSIKANQKVHNHYVIYLGGQNMAQQTGTDISSISGNGYKAVVFMDSLYLYALSEQGFLRGMDAVLREAGSTEVVSLPDNILMDAGMAKTTSIYVGENCLSDYVIVEGSGKVQAQNAAKQLQQYVAGAVGDYLPIKSASQEAQSISLLVDSTMQGLSEQVVIENGQIQIIASTVDGLGTAVCHFANTYLGWAFAGDEREYLLDGTRERRIPDSLQVVENPWMVEREPIVCLWKTNYARGEYFSPNVQLQSELMTYSDDQLYEYIKMMKYCGYTGIQVTDMCSTWGGYGGYEYVQQRLRFMADAAHSLGMKFTLWVWGAEFEGYSWVDHSLAFYDEEHVFAKDNPAAIATFEKYYSIYAQLADCSDRVIAHYSDPGVLNNSDDIGFFAAMLMKKCHEVNPGIDFGVNCYRDDINPVVLHNYLGSDVTYYTGASRTEDEDWTVFRTHCVNLGARTGVWSWNLAEMEIDQLSEMNVNAKLIKRVYQQSMVADAVLKPEYWSEMDSYHVLNLFSMYCAGQLLQNPEEDPQALLYQIAKDTVGADYAEAFYEALNVIQDARTGETWETFRWNYDEWVMASDLYPAADLMNRSYEAVDKLQAMIDAGNLVSVVPLPVSAEELLQMIVPHLLQIGQYAAFRAELNELQQVAGQLSAEDLSNRLQQIYTAIPEYNCIIGLWGQPEMIAQYRVTKAFCEQYGVSMPTDQLFDYSMKQRIYAEICERQRINKDKEYYTVGAAWQFTNPYDSKDVERWLNLLVEDGILQKLPTGEYYLTNWESFIYAF